MLRRPLLLVVAAVSGTAALPRRQLEDQPQATIGPRPVTLTWDRTGDFGPHTPHTRTHGWQEALDHCAGLVAPGPVQPNRQHPSNQTIRGYNIELQVQGGGGVYHLRETLVFPPFQDFQIDGGVWILNFEGNMSTDAVVIDSLMNVHIELGAVVYGGTAAALRIRPQRNTQVLAPGGKDSYAPPCVFPYRDSL